MEEEFDIDKYLNDAFSNDKVSKIEEKEKKKKLNKVLDKQSTKINSNTKSMNIDEDKNVNKTPLVHYNFDKVIDNRVNEGLNININISKEKNVNKTSINVEDVLMPLFPNEKVFKSEYTSDKIFLLDKFIDKKAKVEKEHTKIRITHEIIEQIKNDKSLNYNELYDTMHNLWKMYIKNLLNKAQQPDTIFNKMLKADFHGAIIEISDSKNKNQIGIKGIVLLETKRSFVIITQTNKVKTLLKKGSVFRIDLDYTSVKIIGDNFMYKAIERTKTKFKNKYII